MAQYADTAALWIGWTVIALGAAAAFGALLWLLVHRISVNAMRTAREVAGVSMLYRWLRKVNRLQARRKLP